MADQQQAAPQDIVYTPPQVGTLVLNAIEERRRMPGAGVRTHIPDIDKRFLPLRPGELVTVMGRPSNYKTGLMQYWAREEAKKILDEGASKEMVVFVTWEMAVEELGLYDLAAQASLNAAEISQGRVSEQQWAMLQAAAMKRSALPIWIFGHSIERRKRRPRLTVSNVLEALLYVEDEIQYHPRVIFLDYLQQMEAEAGETRRMQVFENVYKCKDMALSMGCPVVLGIQAHRDVDKREWKLPTMGDGMETSNIEHTADKMLSLWMPKTTEEVGNDLVNAPGLKVTDNLLIVGVMKQKFGPAGWWKPVHVEPERGKITPMQVEPVERW